MCITLEYTGISSATTPAVKNPICAVVRNYGGPLSVHTSDRPHGPVVGACSGVLARLFVRTSRDYGPLLVVQCVPKSPWRWALPEEVATTPRCYTDCLRVIEKLIKPSTLRSGQIRRENRKNLLCARVATSAQSRSRTISDRRTTSRRRSSSTEVWTRTMPCVVCKAVDSSQAEIAR
jgi:hypothetical protein